MAENAIVIPEIKEILTTGLQFGHSTSRWNPRMAKYIFGNKNGIHIIDIVQSRQLILDAANFLTDAASKGDVVFVGTKRQAADIVRNEAMRAGAHFITGRWAGGIFTNYDMVRKSLMRLRDLERMFEEGVEGRTKYEVSLMKTEWQRLNRIYGGIKGMEKLPTAVVVIDPHYEKVAVREARKVHIPVVALADTNSDPRMIDYIIPGNDDALGSIEFVMKTMANAVAAGNEGKGVQHIIKDYGVVEVKIIKSAESEAEDQEAIATLETKAEAKPAAMQSKPTKKGKSVGSGMGMLEAARERASAAKEEVKAEEKAKPVKEKKVKADKPKAEKAAKKPAKKAKK